MVNSSEFILARVILRRYLLNKITLIVSLFWLVKFGMSVDTFIILYRRIVIICSMNTSLLKVVTLTIFLSLSLANYLQAQNERIDSLRQKLSVSTLPLEQAKVIHNIILSATVINLDTAEVYSKKLLSLSEKLDSGNYDSQAYKCLAEVFRRRAKFEEAIAFASIADSLAMNPIMKTQVNNILGNIYFFKDEFDSAAKYYGIAAQMALKSKNYEEVSRNYNGLGMSYFRQGDYAEALQINLKALNLVDSLDLNIRTGSIYGVIGIIYQNLNKYEEAYQNYEKAIAADSIKSDPRGVITWKINWAIALEREGKYDESEAIYFQSLADSKTYNYPRLTANVLTNMGALYKKKGDIIKSIETFEKAYKLADEIGATHLIAFDIQNLGSLYLENNDPEGAKKYLLRGRQMAYELDDPAFIRDIHLALADYYERTGRFDSALANFQTYSIRKDSILNDSNLKEIGKIEAEYEYQKQKIIDDKAFEYELNIQQEKQKRQSIILVIVLLSALIILGLLIVLYRRFKLISNQKSIIEEQAQKLKALDITKSNFFTNISHDLRSPLTLILGSMDQVLEEETISKDAKELLESGYRNGKKLLFMTDEIRDLSRLQEGKLTLKLQLVKIHPYVNLLVKMFSSAANFKKIDLKFESYIDQNKTVKIDPHQFEKIIYNLLSNAVKHTEEYGKITVRLSEVAHYPDKVQIEVRDTGIGLSSADLKHVFDRYYQASPHVQGEHVGFGIGLALSKEIADLHQASISAESREGEGASFKVLLAYTNEDSSEGFIVDEYYEPIYAPMMEAVAEEKIPDNTAIKKDKTILIVEDHREIRRYIDNLLKNQYNTLLAKNGEEALLLLKKEKVDLIISDLMMPYMDGFELLKNLKSEESFAHIPVLIISARTNEEDKLEILKLGANEIIAKPFSPAEITLRLENILSKKSDNSVLALFDPSNVKSGLENIISEKVKQLILERIDDPNLSVMDFCDLLSASERKVFRLFKKIFNLTPLEVIKETRWQYLDKLMKDGKVELTASEAGRTIGIKNVSYFKKQYQERFNQEYSN